MRMSKAAARDCLKRQSRLLEGKTMEAHTEKHFHAWLERSVHSSEQHETEKLIQALLCECPELLADRSWPELRAIAEATINNKRG